MKQKILAYFYKKRRIKEINKELGSLALESTGNLELMIEIGKRVLELENELETLGAQPQPCL